MKYPDSILPQSHYKATVEAALDGFYLCRAVAHALSEEDLFLLPLEDLHQYVHPHGHKELFGYSINLPLPGKFRPEHCRIELIGADKKRFTDYWTPDKIAQRPTPDIDFQMAPDKSWFFLSFSDLNEKIRIPKPLKVAKGTDDMIRLKIQHAPTCCNYWHFEFKWLDKEGNPVKDSKSTWKEEIAATMRAVLIQHIILNSPENPNLPEAAFVETNLE